MKLQLLGALVTCLLVVAPALNALAPQEEPQPNVNEVTIPEGTEFKLQLHSTIDSKTSKSGDRVITTLLDPVAVEDRDVLTKGLRIDGHIGEVKSAGRRGKGGFLTIVFDTVELSNGEKVAILGSLTEIFSSEGGGDPVVGPEGDLKGRGPGIKKRAMIAAGPVAAGAASGSPAAAIPAAVGGMMAAILLPRGKQAALLAGSLIGMRLDRDVTFVLPPSSK